MKQLSKWMRNAAAILCVVLLFTACSSKIELLREYFGTFNESAPNTTQQTGERRTIPYSDIEYMRPDAEAITTRLYQLRNLASIAQSFDEIIEYSIEAGTLTEEFYTMMYVAYLKSYQYTDNSYWEDEYRFCSNAQLEISAWAAEFNTTIIEGRFAEDYRLLVGDYIFASMQSDLLLVSDEIGEYEQELTELNIDYYRYLSTLTITFNGAKMTLLDIEELYYSNYDEYLLAFQQYGEEHADTYAECYSRMIELEKLSAQALGAESAAEVYHLIYSRDYTPADVEALFDNVKEIFVPLMDTIYAETVPSTPLSMAMAFNSMPDALANVDPELAQAWDHMITYEMVDFEARPNKINTTAFCIDLPAYDTPFIYGYWTNDFYSGTTLMHEFGHYYDSWLRYDTSVISNLDISETYSQGLELLLQEYYGEFTINPANAKMENLQGFMNSLTYQVMLEEFQYRLYEQETLDTDTISQLFAQLLKEYGYDYTTTDENDYSWLRVSHLFDSPFYTISYFTSACVALQIWKLSQTDWREAADIYLDMIHADQNQPFIQLVQSVGLNSPFDEETLWAIADAMTAAFSEEAAAA